MSMLSRLKTLFSNVQIMDEASYRDHVRVQILVREPDLVITPAGSLGLEIARQGYPIEKISLEQSFDLYKLDPARLDTFVLSQVNTTLEALTLAGTSRTLECLILTMQNGRTVDASIAAADAGDETGLAKVLAFERNGELTPATGADLESLGLTLIDALAIAEDNLARRIDELMVTAMDDGVWVLQGPTFPASSVQAVPAFWQKGPFVRARVVGMAMPEPNLVVAVDLETPGALEKGVELVNEVTREATELLAPDFVTVKDERANVSGADAAAQPQSDDKFDPATVVDRIMPVLMSDIDIEGTDLPAFNVTTGFQAILTYDLGGDVEPVTAADLRKLKVTLVELTDLAIENVALRLNEIEMRPAEGVQLLVSNSLTSSSMVFAKPLWSKPVFAPMRDVAVALVNDRCLIAYDPLDDEQLGSVMQLVQHLSGKRAMPDRVPLVMVKRRGQIVDLVAKARAPQVTARPMGQFGLRAPDRS
jgi:hypothetical protein